MTYIIHDVHLLSSDSSAIIEGEAGSRSESRYLRQPELEEAQFDEDELVVLAELLEAWDSFGKLYNSLDVRRHTTRPLLP